MPVASSSTRMAASCKRRFASGGEAARWGDRGKSLETFVFLTLRRKGLPVYYWRDGGEVDFVVRGPGEAVFPIQVSWDGPTDLHFRALERFYERHPYARNEIVVDSENAPEFASTLEAVLSA